MGNGILSLLWNSAKEVDARPSLRFGAISLLKRCARKLTVSD